MSQEPNNLQYGAAPPAEVRAQLERILASPGFQASQRRAKLLRFLVEQALDDPDGSLKESVIATEVFDRPSDYDPQVDSIVRVEIGRLRSRLAEYYGQGGGADGVRIEIPKGGYRPVFAARHATAAAPTEAAETPLATPLARGPVRRTRRVAIGLAAGAAVLGVAGALAWRGAAGKADTASVAVLPFLNLSGDPANEYLGEGISEEVTEALSQSSGLRVVSRTSAFQFKGKSADIREIGRRLGASAIVEGSVARRDDEWHIVAQLIRTEDGYHIWSETYDGAPSELPAAESRIAQSVEGRLAPQQARTASASRPPDTPRNPEAHDLYLRAAFAFNRRTVESARQAIALAQQAAAKDPAYAQPYVLMAASESLLTTLYAQAPEEAAVREREEIGKALALDPNNSAAHGQKAMLDYVGDWNWPEAAREFRLALSSGSHGAAENLYGWCLMTRGRFGEAREHLQTAAELDPLSLGPQLNQVVEVAFEGDLKAAKAKANSILSTAPGNPVALAAKASIAMVQNDCPAAADVSDKLTAGYPSLPFAWFAQMYSDFACGRKAKGLADWAAIQERADAAHIPAYSLAPGFAALGESDKAFAALEKAAQRHEPLVLYLKVDHTLDNLRGNPRFTALEKRIGLVD